MEQKWSRPSLRETTPPLSPYRERVERWWSRGVLHPRGKKVEQRWWFRFGELTRRRHRSLHAADPRRPGREGRHLISELEGGLAATKRRGVSRCSIPPEVLEPGQRQLRIAHGVLNVFVALSHCTAYCDKDGKQDGRPINTWATDWHVALQRQGYERGLRRSDGTVADWLAGNVVVVCSNEPVQFPGARRYQPQGSQWRAGGDLRSLGVRQIDPDPLHQRARGLPARRGQGRGRAAHPQPQAHR